jgi:hypothetical protein
MFTLQIKSQPTMKFFTLLTVCIATLLLVGSISFGQPNPGLPSLEAFDQWSLYRQGVQFRQVSSSDPLGEEHDGSGFLYQQDSLYVIFEQEGPGCVYRLWIDGTGSASNRTIKFFFDRSQVPSISIPIQQLFSGLYYPFVTPLVGAPTVSSGGYYCYFPICFAEHLRIALVGDNVPYQIGFQLYPSGTAVTSYTGTENPTTVQDQWQNTGSDPKNPTGNITESGNVTLAPLGTQIIYSHTGGGSITSIRLTPNETVLSVLESMRVKMFWDGNQNPQVDCSLGSFFGTSLGLADISGLPIGIEGNEFYCYFSMPYWSDARIELYNSSLISTVHVAFNLTYKQELYPSDHGYFCVKQQSISNSQPDLDLLLPEFGGHGNLIGITLSLTSSNSSYYTGDLRIYQDGIAGPIVQGTNYDNDFNAANGSSLRSFSTAMDGFPVIIHGIQTKTCAYRFLLGDLIPFGNHISIRAEHGDRNTIPLQYNSVIYAYRRPELALVLSDEFNVGDVSSEQAHNYSVQGGQTSQTHSYAYPGSYDNQFFPDDGHTSFGISSFTVQVDPTNDGVRLVRRRDAGIFPQSAIVRVGGDSLGMWWDSDYNPYKRWADSYYEIPAIYTQGQSQIDVSLELTGSTAWSEYYYWVYSHVSPQIDAIPPQQVVGLVANTLEDGTQAQLNWDSSIDNMGIENYNIYRSLQQNFQPAPGNKIATSPVPTFTDYELIPGSFNYYRVNATDFSGNEGGLSDEVFVRTSDNFIFEAENFRDVTTSPNDAYIPQNMTEYGDNWSNQTQLLFAANDIGDYLSVTLEIAISDTYDLSGYLTKAFNCGILSFRVDGVTLGIPYDLYLPIIQRSPEVAFGTFYLPSGIHTFTYSVAGKNAASSDYILGIDNLVLHSHYLSPVAPDSKQNLPQSFSLEYNFPNPFNTQTTIKFNLAKSGFTTLKVVDLMGRDVAVLTNKWFSQGGHELNWNASGNSSGIYFIELKQEKKTAIKKILLLK